jgi:hypothetical protein
MSLQSYFVDVNSAGFHTLKLREKDGAVKVVMPLGMDVHKANSSAIQYVNLLANPNALLEVHDEQAAFLTTILPFKKHKGKTIAKVIVEDPDYLIYIYRTYNEFSPTIGDCWKSLNRLSQNEHSEFARALRESSEHVPSKAESDYIGGVGDSVTLTLTVKNVFNIPSKFEGDNFKVICETDEGDAVIVTGASKAVRLLHYSQRLAIKQSFIVSGQVSAHETYKGIKQTKLAKISLLPKKITAGILLKFKYPNTLHKQVLTDSLSGLTLLSHPAIGDSELSEVIIASQTESQPTYTGNGQVPYVDGSAIFRCELLAFMTHSELKDAINGSPELKVDSLSISSIEHCPVLEN